MGPWTLFQVLSNLDRSGGGVEAVSGSVLDYLVGSHDHLAVAFVGDDADRDFLGSLGNVSVTLVRTDDGTKAAQFGLDVERNGPALVYFRWAASPVYSRTLIETTRLSAGKLVSIEGVVSI